MKVRINRGIINFILLNVFVATSIIFSKFFYPGMEVYFCFGSLLLVLFLKVIYVCVRSRIGGKTNKKYKQKSIR